MRRQQQSRATVRRPSAPDLPALSASHPVLALQRQLGNAAVSRLIDEGGPRAVQLMQTQTMPGSWLDDDSETESASGSEYELDDLSAGVRNTVEGMGSTSFSLMIDQFPAPPARSGGSAELPASPGLAELPFYQESLPGSRPTTPGLADLPFYQESLPGSRPPSPGVVDAFGNLPFDQESLPGSRRPSMTLGDGFAELPFDHESLPGDRTTLTWWQQVQKHFNGDVPKSVAAGVSTVAQDLTMGNLAGRGADLAPAATGMSSVSAIGDSVSEFQKMRDAVAKQDAEFELKQLFTTGTWNLPKFMGGVLSLAGLMTNVGGIADGNDKARYGGLAVQAGGLMSKGIGEGFKFEKAGAPAGDRAKMYGNLIASLGPLVNIYGVKAAREIAKQLKETGKADPNIAAAIAAALAMGSGAGDFMSEVVKGQTDKKVNVPKLVGGLLNATGAGFTAIGIGTQLDIIRYVGLGFQELGQISKAAGEGHKWEEESMGNVANWPAWARYALRIRHDEPAGAV